MNTATQGLGPLLDQRYFAQNASTEELKTFANEGFAAEDVRNSHFLTLDDLYKNYSATIQELDWRNQFAGRRYINQ